MFARARWSSRPWALPYLAVRVLSQKACQRLNKTHRSGIEWTAYRLEKVRAWYPGREIVYSPETGQTILIPADL